MCGILGLVSKVNASVTGKKIKQLTDQLFLLAESRGKEASGFAASEGKEIFIYKTAKRASTLLKTSSYKKILTSNKNGTCIIGHSRLVTNGAAALNVNNQPFIKEEIIGVHNGIIVNQKELWGKYPDEKKQSDLDSELIPTLLGRFFKENGDMSGALEKMYSDIYGMTSIALLFSNYNRLLLATNNGALYYLPSRDGSVFIFSSEKIMLEQAVKKTGLSNSFDVKAIVHLTPGRACSVNLETLKIKDADFEKSEKLESWNKLEEAYSIEDISPPDSKKHIVLPMNEGFDPGSEFLEYFEGCKERIKNMKRCKKCLLPETFPFLKYNADGICNFCENYKKLEFKGPSSFKDELQKHKKNDGSPDCIVAFSGGRDSCFALHYVKNVLGMNPLAYSYDWGMITDLARRNQARLCDKLGVEHIYISADIPKKRKNIQKNVLAWLKRPNLGTIPLFMAGDKQYFYYANKLMKDYKIDALIMGDNMLEATNFKGGFCGIQPVFDRQRNYHIPLSGKLKMLGFYGKEYLLNPSYLNRSLIDTVKAFLSYYVIPHNFINIFDYIEWKQEMVEEILFGQYDWETSPSTVTTWRIGDGTVAFYNYIYYIIAGFTENDTFRSNQIREGQITREEALKDIALENKAQWGGIKWYLDTINVDFEKTMRTINKIPKLYK
ncbi:hypothetical protein HOG48_02070 [Candidatus Peregrinibacteria bacterium]|jgi:glutamine---fructose-6-phosphate transaminase (isomerizing)|nr:hypothetical protein [Candidatus Peregrinibacteria bacterium]